MNAKQDFVLPNRFRVSRGARMVRKGARAAVVYCAPLGAETSRGAMFSSLMKPTTLSTMYGMKYIA